MFSLLSVEWIWGIENFLQHFYFSACSPRLQHVHTNPTLLRQQKSPSILASGWIQRECLTSRESFSEFEINFISTQVNQQLEMDYKTKNYYSIPTSKKFKQFELIFILKLRCGWNDQQAQRLRTQNDNRNDDYNVIICFFDDDDNIMSLVSFLSYAAISQNRSPAKKTSKALANDVIKMCALPVCAFRFTLPPFCHIFFLHIYKAT